MSKIKIFGYYNSKLEFFNASMCYSILETFSWYSGKNFIATWLGNQIPYESW